MLPLLNAVTQRLSSAYNKLNKPPKMTIYLNDIRPMPDFNDISRELKLVAEELSPDDMREIIHHFGARYIHEISQSKFIAVIQACRMARNNAVILHKNRGNILC